jgi:hypothetical protein
MATFTSATKTAQAAIVAAKAKYNTAAESLRRLEAAEKAAGGATKESTKWRKAGERALAATARELDRATKALEKNAQAQRKANVEQIKAARLRLFGQASKTPLFQKAGQQIGGVAREAFLLGTAGAGAAAAMGALVIKTLKAADEVGDTADKLGIGAEKLQELRYGAAQSGAEVGSLDRSLGKMAITIGKFKAPKGKGGAGGFAIPGVEMLGTGGEGGGAAEANPFKRIGLDAKKLAALKPEEQLKKIAAGMATLKTHADRAAVAQAIFGKGATDIIPFLEEGAAGIDRLARDAHKYGGVLSAEAIKNADLADKAMRDAEMAFGGLTATLTADLLPVATKVFKEFSGFVAGNRAQIKAWAESTAKWVENKGIPALKELAREAKDFALRMVELVQGAAGLVGGFRNLGYVLVGLRLAPLAITMAKISATTFKAADGLFKYAAAAKQAQAVGGVSQVKLEGGGKLLGLAASAAMLAQAAAIGYAIGSALDSYFGLSDKIVGFARKVTGQDAHEAKVESLSAEINQIALQRQKVAKQGLVRKYEREGYSHGQANYFAEKLTTPTNGAGISISVGDVTVGGATREDAEAQLDEALEKIKHKVLEHIDRHQAHKKRVALGQ